MEPIARMKCAACRSGTPTVTAEERDEHQNDFIMAAKADEL